MDDRVSYESGSWEYVADLGGNRKSYPLSDILVAVWTTDSYEKASSRFDYLGEEDISYAIAYLSDVEGVYEDIAEEIMEKTGTESLEDAMKPENRHCSNVESLKPHLEELSSNSQLSWSETEDSIDVSFGPEKVCINLREDDYTVEHPEGFKLEYSRLEELKRFLEERKTAVALGEL